MKFLPTTNHKLQTVRKGQVLVEVLVAISVLTIGFMGISTLLSRSLSLNRVVLDNFTGSYLAAEGIEVVKNILDSNKLQSKTWNAGMTPGTYEVTLDSPALNTGYQDRFLYFNSQTHLFKYDGDVITPFKRKISISWPGNNDNEIRVNSEVSWVTRGGGSFKINLEDHFYNWR